MGTLHNINAHNKRIKESLDQLERYLEQMVADKEEKEKKDKVLEQLEEVENEQVCKNLTDIIDVL